MSNRANTAVYEFGDILLGVTAMLVFVVAIRQFLF